MNIDLQKEKKEANRPAGPKKFVFDFVNDQLKNQEAFDSNKNSKNLQFLRYVPIIHGFIEPEDLRKAYEDLCDDILDAYNEFREMFLAVRTLYGIIS